MSVLIIAEHNNQELKQATLNTVSAGLKIEGNVDILVIGHDCKSVADEAAKINSAANVIYLDNEAYKDNLAENIADAIKPIAADYTHILIPSTTTGKNIMPRLSALLDIQQISDIIDVLDEKTYLRPYYAGNAIATVESLEDKKLLTVRTTGFDLAEIGSGTANIKAIDTVISNDKATFISRELTKSERPELTSAKIIVSGGRGVGSAENFEILEKLADKLNAAIGASRAAVDAGYVPNDYQVGQTGKVVAPDLYIAIGLSGAIQHLAGMKDSKIIVTINKDEDAPIFGISDYGIVGDLFDIVPKLTEAL